MKMPLSLFLPLVLLAGSAGPAAAIDFTLHRKAGVADAIQVEHTFITDDTSKIYLRIPPHWTDASTPASLDLTPDRAQSSVRVEQVPGVKSLAFDEASRPALRQRGAAGALPGATGVKPVSETLDVLPIFGWKSFEIVQSFQLPGQTFYRSVLFLDISANRVLQVTVYAPQSDYEAVHKGMLQMLGSWFEPSRDLPPDLARKYEEQAGKGE